MKKICFVIPRAYYLFNSKIEGLEDKVGGAQKQAYILSTSLAENEKFNVNFITADFGQKDFEEIQNVKIWKSFKFSDNIIKRISFLIKTLKQVNSDIYIFRSADAGVGFAIFYIKVFLKKKVLYMIASDIETSKSTQRTNFGILTSLFMQYVYNKADILTAQTKDQAKLFQKNRNRKPNSIIKNIYITKESTDKIKTSVLWVGRLTKNKNPEIFISLAQKYPDKNFIMIAPIVKEQLNYGKKIQQSAKNIKNVHLINYVKPGDIDNYYQDAKIYALTSNKEGFSNTMAEAMMAKCAILSFNVNPDNILQEHNCGLFSEKDINKFSENFEKLIKNENLCKELGANGAEYIKKNHKKSMIIKQFEKLLIG